MADNDQNFGGQNAGQNPDQQKRPESPASSQKNTFKRKRFRYAKKVKGGQTMNNVKREIGEIKPKNGQNNKIQNINRNDVNQNRNRVIGRVVDKKEKSQFGVKPKTQVKSLNPFLVDFEPKKEVVKPVDLKPVEPKLVEPKKVESAKIEPRKEMPKPVEPKKVELAKIEPLKEKPQESVKPINPFMVEPKKDFEPANEGDEDLGEVITGEVVEKPKREPVAAVKKLPEQKPVETKPQAKEVDESPIQKESIRITKKRVVYSCGVVIGIVALIVVGIFILNFFKEQNKIPRGVEQVQEAGGNYGVISSYLLGVQFSKNANILKYSNYSGALFALELGQVSYVGGQYADYMEVLRQMQNIYDTNVYDLIDMSSDRRALLKDHLAKMQALIDRGEGIYYDIVDKMTRLNDQYGSLTVLQTQSENAFFEAVRNLQSENASAYMNSFVNVSQEMVQVKAYFGAYKSFKAMFANSVNALKPRYQDILLNEEAIIQGIYVFDVPGSDIGAIIRLDTVPSK